MKPGRLFSPRTYFPAFLDFGPWPAAAEADENVIVDPACTATDLSLLRSSTVFPFVPTAHAVGYILTPLRGWSALGAAEAANPGNVSCGTSKTRALPKNGVNQSFSAVIQDLRPARTHENVVFGPACEAGPLSFLVFLYSNSIAALATDRPAPAGLQG